MAKKETIPADEKFEDIEFDLFKAINALDSKDYGYYDRLTSEQQKRFVPYNILLWMSAVKSKNPVLAEYYLNSANHYANTFFLDSAIQDHPKLLWLMLCAISPGIGKQFHEWIPHLNSSIMTYKKFVEVDQLRTYFSKLYPNVDIDLDEIKDEQHRKTLIAMNHPELKIEDINVLCQLMTEEDFKQYGS